MGSESLRPRIATLRLSLLAAAGLLPIACGGAMRGDGQDEGGGAGGFMRWALERDPQLVRGRLQAALVCPPANDASAEDLVVPVLYALLRNGASRELAA
jgi:hypothetical protein